MARLGRHSPREQILERGLHPQQGMLGGVLHGWLVLQGKLSGQVMMATLSVVGTRAMQVYTSAQFARARVSTRAFLLSALRVLPVGPF